MSRAPPRYPRTDPRFPYTTLCRSAIRWTVREGVTCILRRALHGAPVPFVIVISARQRWAPAIAVAIGRGDFQHPRIAEPAAGGLVTRHANALLQPRQR